MWIRWLVWKAKARFSSRCAASRSLTSSSGSTSGPVAYQMSAVHAIERALRITIDPAVRQLRRLFYCGEWIESHTLHVFMVHAPDFLGYPDVIAMARDHRAMVEQALRLKKTGNRIIALLGGREIHPVSAAIGGFYRVSKKSELRELIDDLKWALNHALASVKFLATLTQPAFWWHNGCANGGSTRAKLFRCLTPGMREMMS